MKSHLKLSDLLLAAMLACCLFMRGADACCPAGPLDRPVINADQTVIMIWDAATKTEHFIRQASFKGEAADFGFIVPTPAKPELEESGNEAFAMLSKLTAPEIIRKSKPFSFGCSDSNPATPAPPKVAAASVEVLEEKLVAGFNAVVLAADSEDALVDWLKEHGYAYSPAIAEWARPYVQAKWKFTAMKVARGKDGETLGDVRASALRISFKTDRPLFPYREPDSTEAAAKLGARDRLLRIYFVAEARYRGELTPEESWSGATVWSGHIGPVDRMHLLEQLKLPLSGGPTDWWLTEFEDHWAYRKAPADVYFARTVKQDELRRPPIVYYASAASVTDLSLLVIAAGLTCMSLGPRMARAIRR